VTDTARTTGKKLDFPTCPPQAKKGGQIPAIFDQDDKNTIFKQSIRTKVAKPVQQSALGRGAITIYLSI